MSYTTNTNQNKSENLIVSPTTPSKEPLPNDGNLISPTISACSSEELRSSDGTDSESTDFSHASFLDDDWLDEDFAENDEEIQRMTKELDQEVRRCREEVEEYKRLCKEQVEEVDRDIEELNNHPFIRFVRQNEELTLQL